MRLFTRHSIRRAATGFVALREQFLFLICVAMTAAAMFGIVRANGIAVLLLASVAAGGRLFSPPAIVLAAALVAMKTLKLTGNWYAAHAISDFVAVISCATAALLSLPTGWKARLARLSPRQVAVFAVALPVFVFQLNTNPTIATGDTQPVLPTAVQMLRHGNRDLSAWCADGRWAQYPPGGQPYFLREVAGRGGLYSSYPAGMELFALPAVAVAPLFGMNLDDTDNLARLERITASLISSATLGLFYVLALHFVKPLTAYVATVLLATGSTFTSTTGLALWQQTGVAFWIVVALLCEVNGRWRWLQAFACAAMLACRPSAATFLVPYGVWLVMNDWPRGLRLILTAVFCYFPWAILYQSHYGSIFGPSMNQLNEHWQFGENLSGVLFSPARGLFVYQPWIFLIVLSFFTHPQRQKGRIDPPSLALRVSVAAILLHILLVSSWPVWWGGHCYGSRLLSEIMPLLGLLLLKPLGELLNHSWGRWLVGTMVVLGLMIHLPGALGSAMAWNFNPVSVDAAPWRLWDWRDPPFLFDLLH